MRTASQLNDQLKAQIESTHVGAKEVEEVVRRTVQLEVAAGKGGISEIVARLVDEIMTERVKAFEIVTDSI
jgi:phosphopantetheine adenylyltransferase